MATLSKEAPHPVLVDPNPEEVQQAEPGTFTRAWSSGLFAGSNGIDLGDEERITVPWPTQARSTMLHPLTESQAGVRLMGGSS